MITKITVDFPTRFSLIKDKPERVYGLHGFEDKKFVNDVGCHLQKISEMIGFFEQYPESKVQTVFNLFFGDGKLNCKNITKRKRVWSFWLCYIHEED